MFTMRAPSTGGTSIQRSAPAEGLQPAGVVLEQQCQEVPVGVRPDTLQVGAVSGPDVVDQLAEPVRLAGEVLVEMAFG